MTAKFKLLQLTANTSSTSTVQFSSISPWRLLKRTKRRKLAKYASRIPIVKKTFSSILASALAHVALFT